ncbi:MAG: hypothetical protein LBT08_08140 [Synergistaceae bacterium]|jgi:hypothetical protein|nr:hypothetical protein [Synergistaceae bacterium]
MRIVKFAKRITSILSLAILLLQCAAPLYGTNGAALAATVYDLSESAPLKGDFGLEEADNADVSMRKPNVLFMIDLSDHMLYNSKGVQPQVVLRSDYDVEKWNPNHDSESNATKDSADWVKTKARFGYTPADVIGLMKNMTFGAGTLPTVFEGIDRTLNNTYGRDIDESNNFKGHRASVEEDMRYYRDSYYFPFITASNDVRRAFDAQVSGSVNKYPRRSDPAQAYPYALVFRDPKYWAKGWTEAKPPTSADLVPNDSRIYQTKLVLWRLLNESPLLDNIKFGMASTYQSIPSMGTDAPMQLNYKVKGKREYGSLFNTTISKIYEYGTAGLRTTGQAYYYRTIDAQQHIGWDTQDFGPLYSEIKAADKTAYKLQQRAYLHMPIAPASRTYGPKNTTHREGFLKWIDGINDVTMPSAWWTDPNPGREHDYFSAYRNPELMPTGSFQTAMAIYPNPDTKYGMTRESYIRDGMYWNDTTVGFPTTWYRLDQYSYSTFLNGSGEAAGSLIDFFSPPIFSKNFHPGYDMVRTMHDVTFPITSVCEDNWVILLTSGVEASADQGSYIYYIRDAIKNLYDHADPKNPKHEKVTLMTKDESGARAFKEVDLQKPIRTIVIGIVANPDDVAGDPVAHREVVQMRKNIEMMAKAGQGGDPEARAYFADDVPSLIRAMNDIMIYIIDRQEQPDKGALLEGAKFGNPDDDEDLNLYSSTYRVQPYDQWDGNLSRFKANVDDAGNITVSRAWTLAGKINQKRGVRNLRYWHDGSFIALGENDPNFQKLTGLTADKVNADNLPGGAFNGREPHKALYDWLQGYDYSYGDSTKYDRHSTLVDFGQSGLVMIDDPKSKDSLPGYAEWAKSIAQQNRAQAPKIYFQTNDGILHIVNPENGNEESAILPPPVLLPHRLPTVKMAPLADGKLQWFDAESSISGETSKRSNSVYLLDGPLQKRRFDLNQTGSADGWGTYLIGTNGRAGSGIYMTDVSTHDTPKFMWYREKIGENLLSMNAGTMVNQNEPVIRTRAELSAGNNKDISFMKLGLNSPKPALGVASLPSPSMTPRQNFIALAGGTQSVINLAANGNEGATLLLLDPKDGALLKAFDSNALANKADWRVGKGTTGPAPYMGMMTSIPTLVKSKTDNYLTGKIFTADNRGNIFKIALEKTGDDGVTVALSVNEWDIETVATLQNKLTSGTSSDSYAIPHGIQAGMDGSAIWLAGGTADVAVRKTDASDTSKATFEKSGDVGGSIPFPKDTETIATKTGTGFLVNAEQLIFAFRTSDRQQKVLFRDSDMMELRADAKDQAHPETLSGSSTSGWYITLENGMLHREYVSAAPKIYGGTLFVPTFLEKLVDPTDTSVCGSRRIGGQSRLYALDLTSGGGDTWDGGKKYIEIDGVKITGLTQIAKNGGNTLLATYDELTTENGADDLDDSHVKHITADGFEALAISPRVPTNKIALRPGQTIINYWLIK